MENPNFRQQNDFFKKLNNRFLKCLKVDKNEASLTSYRRDLSLEKLLWEIAAL